MKIPEKEKSIVSSFVETLFAAFMPKTISNADLPKDKRKREKYYNNEID